MAAGWPARLLLLLGPLAASAEGTIENARGMRVSFIDHGATITAIAVPDRDGKAANILLNLPDPAAYRTTRRRFAAIIGRYAGRIGGARFDLDGKTIQLAANDKGVALHSDPDGFDKRDWRREDFADAQSLGAVFHLDCPEGDQGYPGRLTVNVTYRLMRKVNEFRIEYAAWTDTPTVINLTNHAFFNLAGAGTKGIDGHRFQIEAERYAEIDAKLVPTGKLLDVAGTPFDFRHPAAIPGDIDDSFVLSGAGLRKVATIIEVTSGRRMEISTTETAAVLNSATGFDGSEIGGEGRAYQRHDGFAFETQHLPDSPNHAEFPSTILRPGAVYRSETRYRFSVQR